MESKRRHCNDAMDLDIDKDIFLQRYNSNSQMINNNNNSSSAGNTVSPPEDDDYPLYDSVASDEDLVLTEQQTILAQQVMINYNLVESDALGIS